MLQPEYDLWRHHEYEYELDRIPIDVINGGPQLRQWVDDESRTFSDLDASLQAAESSWRNEREDVLIYR